MGRQTFPKRFPGSYLIPNCLCLNFEWLVLIITQFERKNTCVHDWPKEKLIFSNDWRDFIELVAKTQFKVKPR